MRVFGLTIGICAAIFLNLPILEWKTTIPMTTCGIFGVVFLVWDLIKQRNLTSRRSRAAGACTTCGALISPYCPNCERKGAS